MKRFFLALTLVFSISLLSQAVKLQQEEFSQVDTVKLESESMHKVINSLVILPAQYYDPELQEEQYPVVYLLHGYSGDYKSWSVIKKDLDALATDYGMIFVCPDGDTSWYFDAPANSGIRYETFITGELLPHIDNNYRTIPDKYMRAITGLSMGGHGALWLAFRHTDLFGAAGSTSGGVNFIPFKEKWKIKESLGEYEQNKEVWESHTVLSQVKTLKKGDLKIIFDCGSSDFFIDVNNQLHDAMLKAGIDHDYIVRPGGHNIPYWNNSIDYQLLFFSKAFDEAASLSD